MPIFFVYVCLVILSRTYFAGKAIELKRVLKSES